MESYVASLEDTANTLNGTFESTRDKAARAVSAAEIYEAVAQGIQKAKKEATAAAEDIQGQSEEIARLVRFGFAFWHTDFIVHQRYM